MNFVFIYYSRHEVNHFVVETTKYFYWHSVNVQLNFFTPHFQLCMSYIIHDARSSWRLFFVLSAIRKLVCTLYAYSTYRGFIVRPLAAVNRLWNCSLKSTLNGQAGREYSARVNRHRLTDKSWIQIDFIRNGNIIQFANFNDPSLLLLRHGHSRSYYPVFTS